MDEEEVMEWSGYNLPEGLTLKDYLEQHPDTVLPCICDDPAVPFGHGHFDTCPKSQHWNINRWPHHPSHNYILARVLLAKASIRLSRPLPEPPFSKYELIQSDPFA